MYTNMQLRSVLTMLVCNQILLVTQASKIRNFEFMKLLLADKIYQPDAAYQVRHGESVIHVVSKTIHLQLLKVDEFTLRINVGKSENIVMHPYIKHVVDSEVTVVPRINNYRNLIYNMTFLHNLPLHISATYSIHLVHALNVLVF